MPRHCAFSYRQRSQQSVQRGSHHFLKVMGGGDLRPQIRQSTQRMQHLSQLCAHQRLPSKGSCPRKPHSAGPACAPHSASSRHSTPPSPASPPNNRASALSSVSWSSTVERIPSISNSSRFALLRLLNTMLPEDSSTASKTLSNSDIPILLTSSVSSKLITRLRTPVASSSLHRTSIRSPLN